MFLPATKTEKLLLFDCISRSNVFVQLGILNESRTTKQKLKLAWWSLEDEIARISKAAHLKIDQISALLTAELQEKYYLQQELNDLECKHRETVEKEHQLSQEKDLIIRSILDIYGVSVEDQGELYQCPSDITMLIGKCFDKLRDKDNYSHSSVDAEMFEVVKKAFCM